MEELAGDENHLHAQQVQLHVRDILEKEVERYRKGDFTQNYDWLEDFNKDPEHYRIVDD